MQSHLLEGRLELAYSVPVGPGPDSYSSDNGSAQLYLTQFDTYSTQFSTILHNFHINRFTVFIIGWPTLSLFVCYVRTH